MRYAIRITSDTGKVVTVSGKEYIDIDVIAGNKRIAALTVREGEDGPAVFDAADHDIAAPRDTENED